MGEYFPGEIRIGGKLPVGLLDEFFKCIDTYQPHVGDFDGDLFRATTAEELRDLLEEDGTLRLADNQVSYGQFADIVNFCVLNNLSYDQHSDAHYELDCVNEYWRPGMIGSVLLCSNNRQRDLVDADDLRPILDKLNKLAADEDDLSNDALLDEVQRLCVAMTEAMPPEIPPLCPLELVP